MEYQTRDHFDPSEVLAQLASSDGFKVKEANRLLEEACHALCRLRSQHHGLIFQVGAALAAADVND
jgi:hypothetical protein